MRVGDRENAGDFTFPNCRRHTCPDCIVAGMTDTAELDPRDVVKTALESAVDQTTSATAAGVITALDHAGFAVLSHVWIAQLELIEGQGGWISANATSAGAVDDLVRWCNEMGIGLDEYDPSTGSEFLDNHPDVETYGVSYVPIGK
ncbi:hypothetical protein I5J35_gp07 [Mycobacterium phage Rem711]|uniref:Uncharacterized protein n=1 Tax=Mycobacterium phage Rem711 TaxID=2079285 RepID=A0A2K9VEU4_9CAUD|nr:hypothetical protein I5J35_gp07 [Mycobacterium phage Rem711]AUV60785.1 hypothetical protein SEA_REM711_7 [Mycobacterium phage Rem711]